LTSTSNGRDVRKKVHMENNRNQILRPKNQQKQQPQTPIDQTPKKNESNIRLSQISKPKLPLKQLIEECQLKLSAKKEVK